MAPIPVHTASPISTNAAAYPNGATPSTAAARYTPGDHDAATTTPASPHLSQAAQPAQAAVPAPTNAVAAAHNNRIEPTRTAPQPTGTTRTTDSPPPPQPGAVPSPYANPASQRMTPQPPRPIEIPQSTPTNTPIRHALPSPTPTSVLPVPLLAHQQSPSLYQPSRSIPPAGETSAYPHDLSHPPGYMQDTRASFDDKPVESCQSHASRASPSSSRRGGILDGEPTFERGSESESNVLNAAYAWAKAAGKRLSRTEEQIWKTINGDENT